MPIKRRKRRTKDEIEEIINKAAISLIESGGFSNLTVRNISEKAKIEPVVFYNRYANVEEFIDEFVKKYDYWFTDTVKQEASLGEREEYIDIIRSLFISLKENVAMQQLLRWELFDKNETTRRTARLREFHTIPLVERFKKTFKDAPFEIEVLSAIIIGGIYYLVLHADLTPFARLDVNSKDGQDKVCDALVFLGNIFYGTISGLDTSALDIAKKMKAKGLELNLIEECTKVPINILRNL